MSDMTIVALCQALANITNNRCHLVENSNTCRCIDDMIDQRPTTVLGSPPHIMLSEACLIFFVLAIWLSAIGFCLNRYKSLRRLETQSHYFGNRKDPLNIGDIKIVAREQDSIIYKKKRYSTAPEGHINYEELKAMQYVKEYLPKPATPIPSSIGTISVNEENLSSNLCIPTSTASLYNLSGPIPLIPHTPLSTHNELAEEQQLPLLPSQPSQSTVVSENNASKSAGCVLDINQNGMSRLAAGLTVPYISARNSVSTSWNSSRGYETSYSAQHLCVPSNSLRTNRYSDGNIPLAVPQTSQKASDISDEQLIDPRLIPKTVRQSLLALHRQSQENINTQRAKEKTQSENDVYIAFLPWKIKMKSKLKRTHHHSNQQQPQQQQQHQQHYHYQGRPHSNTLSVVPLRQNSNDQDRRIADYARMNEEYRFSTPPPRNQLLATGTTIRRSLRHFPKYTTQSTTESESTQCDLLMITSTDVSNNDDESTKVTVHTDVQNP